MIKKKATRFIYREKRNIFSYKHSIQKLMDAGPDRYRAGKAVVFTFKNEVSIVWQTIW